MTNLFTYVGILSLYDFIFFRMKCKIMTYF